MTEDTEEQAILKFLQWLRDRTFIDLCSDDSDGYGAPDYYRVPRQDSDLTRLANDYTEWAAR